MLIFVSKLIKTTVIFCLDLMITFFRNRKLNAFVIKTCNHFLLDFLMFIHWNEVSDVTPAKTFIVFTFYTDQAFS